MLSTSKNLTFGVWGEPVNNTFLSAHLSLESVGKKNRTQTNGAWKHQLYADHIWIERHAFSCSVTSKTSLYIPS